jgi:hypothetical protein
MAHVCRVVAEDSGVTLHAEVRLLGFGRGENGPVDGNGGGAGAGHVGAAR